MSLIMLMRLLYKFYDNCQNFENIPKLRPPSPLKDVFHCFNKDVVVIYHFFSYMYEWLFHLNICTYVYPN